LVDFSKYKTLEKSQEEKPNIIPSESDEIDLKIRSLELDSTIELEPKISETDFSNMTISQDDLWFLYRLKFGKGTRKTRSALLPKFTDAFNKNLKEIRK